MVVRGDGCTTCAGRRNEEQASHVHELHDEERDDGDGKGEGGGATAAAETTKRLAVSQQAVGRCWNKRGSGAL